MSIHKNAITLFSLVMFSMTFAQARTFRCSLLETQHDVLRLEIDQKNNLTRIAQIAQLPFSGGNIEGELEDVKSKVSKDSDGTQKVWFSDHYTERITLILNVEKKTASIEVFDVDEWRVTRTQELRCDFEGYYEKH